MQQVKLHFVCKFSSDSNVLFFLGNEGYKEGQSADETEIRAATRCVHY